MKKWLVVLLLFTYACSGFCQTDNELPVLIFGKENNSIRKKITLQGRILDASNQTIIPGAVMDFVSQNANTPGLKTTNNLDGTYQLSVPPGKYVLTISFLGFADYKVELHLYDNGKQDFQLEQGAIDLNEVTVREQHINENVTAVLGGVEQLSREKMERQSKFLGEMDILRSLQTLAGVSSVGEGASGFNVRGGNTDENLILMEGNLLFNPVHALGFFSLFHPDLVSGATLYKGGVPAKYGGRLSSVLDVRLREGDAKQFSAKGGVGIASSRLALEGPIAKNKASFIVGGRVSYVDWILQRTKNVDLNKSQAFFYDVTAKADARLTATTKIGFTALATHDNFRFADEAKFDYATHSGSVYLKQLIGAKINLTAQYSLGQYTSHLFDIEGNDQSKFTNKIRYSKATLSGFTQLTPDLQMELGIDQNRYAVSPGIFEPAENSQLKSQDLPEELGVESSAFFHIQWALTKRIEAMAGIRYTNFVNKGPHLVYVYEPGLPKEEDTISDSLQFSKGQKIATYSGFEPRLSLRINLKESSSIKLGYNRAYQYLSQVSNTASATPIDIWQLADYYIGPQRADNYSAGYYQNFRNNAIQSYVSVFYRDIDQLIDYKDFAQLLLNEHIETELLTGIGRAYGVEFYFHKNYGRHQWEFTYTYSRSLRQIEATAEQESVSGGRWYPSNYDKPHNLSLNYNFEIKPRNSLSVNFTYSTGRPTTAPISTFSNGNVLTIPIYSDRNQFRIPDYHRLDVAYTVGPWGKNPRWRNNLTLSIYNLYFRKNAFSVFFRQRPYQRVTAYRVAVLGTMFPAITYDFKF